MEKLHLAVKARTLVDKEWTTTQEMIFITSQDAAVSNAIASTMWSEGHFMKQNTKWTMISQGSEKYMVYGKVHMHIEGLDRQLPLRVDLREGEG